MEAEGVVKSKKGLLERKEAGEGGLSGFSVGRQIHGCRRNTTIRSMTVRRSVSVFSPVTIDIKMEEKIKIFFFYT